MNMPMMLIITGIFIGVVFYLAKLVVMQLEQRADEDVLRAKDTYGKIIDQKEQAHQEKQRLEKEVQQIFTLYEMTKDISAHFDHEQAFNIFRRRIKENCDLEDVQLITDIDQRQSDKLPNDYETFILKSKDKNLGLLAFKGLRVKDKKKFEILAHQFALAFRRIKLYKEIETLALTDSLTGVYTRRHLMQRLQEEVSRAELRKNTLAYIMVDADHFKSINDQYGHLSGDQVLKEVAHIIRENVREIDIVGRFGGEEFGIVLPETDIQGAMVVAERIRRAAQTRVIRSYDNNIRITVSAGVAVYPIDAQMTEELIDKADWALYRAKSTGRNKVLAFGKYKKDES